MKTQKSHRALLPKNNSEKRRKTGSQSIKNTAKIPFLYIKVFCGLRKVSNKEIKSVETVLKNII
jgi:hypothetical protein